MNKEDICTYLRERSIAYDIREHKAVYHMGELDDEELPYPEVQAKSLFMKDEKQHKYYLVTVRGDKRVDLKAFRRARGLRSFCFTTADELLAILGLTRAPSLRSAC